MIAKISQQQRLRLLQCAYMQPFKTIMIQQPSVWKRYYTFLDNDKSIGWLEETGVFKANIRCEMNGQQWRFVKSSGLKTSEIHVMESGSDKILATYRRKVFRQSGVLDLNGKQYIMKVSAWRSRYTWQSMPLEGSQAEPVPVIEFNMGGFFRRSGSVEIASNARDIDYLLMTALGFYIGKSVDDENSAAAGSAAGAGAVASA